MNTQRIELTLPEEDLEFLKELAKKEEKTVSDITSRVVLNWLKNEHELNKAREKMRVLGGGIFSGPEDLAENHDNYLYGKS